MTFHGGHARRIRLALGLEPDALARDLDTDGMNVLLCEDGDREPRGGWGHWEATLNELVLRRVRVGERPQVEAWRLQGKSGPDWTPEDDVTSVQLREPAERQGVGAPAELITSADPVPTDPPGEAPGRGLVAGTREGQPGWAGPRDWEGDAMPTGPGKPAQHEAEGATLGATGVADRTPTSLPDFGANADW